MALENMIRNASLMRIQRFFFGGGKNKGSYDGGKEDAKGWILEVNIRGQFKFQIAYFTAV